MFTWITENLSTVLVAAVLLGLVALAVIKLVRNRQKGESACGCSCGGCPQSQICHPKKEIKDNAKSAA